MVTYVERRDNENSVKDVGIIKQPTAEDMGLFDHRYSDRYSVFDWGPMPMPDSATLDNRPVAVVAAYNFELLGRHGIDTAYLGAVGDDGETHALDWFRQNGEVPNTLRNLMVHVLKPDFVQEGESGHWDYSKFRDPQVAHHLHPIEFIWRAHAGSDSSFWKNVAAGSYTLADLGLPDNLKPGDSFH